MAHRAEYRARKVKTCVAEMPELVVYVITEYIQKEHVAEDMKETAVQKSVSDKLPQKRASRRENKLFRPGTQKFS
jgi:hypothetical protein